MVVILTPKPPTPKMYTRYLYHKTDVENALILSLLFPSPNYLKNRGDLFRGTSQCESAFFWAYELYYSGFVQQLITLFWRIYYDFYAVKYAFLERYFQRYLQEERLKKYPKIVGFVIRNFLYNRPTLDVFLAIRNSNADANAPQMAASLKNHPNVNIVGIQRLIYRAQMVYNQSTAQPATLLLKGFDNVTAYETVEDVPPYRVLSIGRQGDLRQHARYMGIFGAATAAPSDNWLFECLLTPFWRERITAYGGSFNLLHGRVDWETDEDMENFHDEYGYEPDEQSADTQARAHIEHAAAVCNIDDFIRDFYAQEWQPAPAGPTMSPHQQPQKMPPLLYEPIYSISSALTTRVTEMLAETPAESSVNWYMQVVTNLGITEDLLQTATYKGLRKTAIRHITTPKPLQ